MSASITALGITEKIAGGCEPCITQRTYTGTCGSLCRPDRDFPTFVRWYQRGQLDLEALVTQRYSLDQINDAVADLAGGRIHGRSIITYA